MKRVTIRAKPLKSLSLCQMGYLIAVLRALWKTINCPGLFPWADLPEGGGAARFSKYIFTMTHINFFHFSEKET